MLTALRAAGSSSSLGTICRIVAPARVRRGAARSSNPSLTRMIHHALVGDRQGLRADTPRLLSAAACGETTVCRKPGCDRSTNEAPMDDSCLKTLNVGTGSSARPIAVRARPGGTPGLFWLGGFKSDMRGTKAEALDAWAGRNGRAMRPLRLFRPRRIGRDLHRRHHRPLAGGKRRGVSRAAASVRRSRSARPWAAGSRCCWRVSCAKQGDAGGPALAGLVLIAPAVDFTEELMWKRMPPRDPAADRPTPASGRGRPPMTKAAIRSRAL